MRRKQNHKMQQHRRGHGRSRGDNNAGKIKNVAANRDKYLNLARDALASGDRVEAENYLQHAEHYFRVLSYLQEEDARNRPQPQERAQDGEGEGDSTAESEPAQEANADDDGNIAMAS